MVRRAGKPGSKLDRRSFVKGAASAGAFVLGCPAYVRNARSSSGYLNIMAWPEALPRALVADFTRSTGIAVHLQPVLNEARMLEAAAAPTAEPVDLVSPTAHRAPQWLAGAALQPLARDLVALERVEPGLLNMALGEWNPGGRGLVWLPHYIATEAIALRGADALPIGDAPSYGDIWSEEHAGRSAGGSARNLMLGAGLFMETTGALERGSVWRAFAGPDAMRAAWDRITAWCIARKERIGRLAEDGSAQFSALTSDTVTIAQCGQGPARKAVAGGHALVYRAPREGALAWLSGLAIPAAAANVEQAHALLAFCSNPRNAARLTMLNGYPSAVPAAARYVSDIDDAAVAAAFPSITLADMHPLPPEPQWYSSMRDRYVTRFLKA